ncbi:MAG: AIPR family protein [Nitrososphaerales archaeon]
MDEQDFFDKFTRLLQNMKEKYELDNLHDALLVWFAENYLLLDPEDVRDRIVQDAKAEGIDAILVDERGFQLLFVQAKTVEDFAKTSNPFPENVIKLTLAGARLLIRGNYKGQITPELENLTDEYQELEKTGDYKTKILFIALKGPPTDIKFIRDFQKDIPVEIEFWGFNELLAFYRDVYLVRRAPPPERISFEVLADVLKKDSPVKARIFTTKGIELARNYDTFKERIFQQNVRSFLGSRSKSINEQIVKTAADNGVSKNFWYYNNGVTIVCKKIPDSATGRTIHLEEAQIINGAQTTYSLYEAFKKGTLQDDVEVLIKAIETPDRRLIENVTMFTNSQNAIKLRDLCSNDDVQVKTQKLLLETYHYFYEKKRGEFDSSYPTVEAKSELLGQDYKKKLISNENAAQAFLAMFLNRPAEAKSEKRRIFMKDGGFYEEIFDEEDPDLAEKMLVAWRLLKFVEGRKREYKKSYKTAIGLQEEQRNRVYKNDFLLHGEYFALNLMRDFLQNVGIDLTHSRGMEQVLSMLDSNGGLVVASYDKIVEALSGFFDEEKAKQGYYHNKFFKNEKSLTSVRNALNTRLGFVQILQ